MNDIALPRAVSVFLADETATLALGRALAEAVTPPLTVWLEGDLGAGKTTLVRGLLHGLGHHGAVKSPTYALVESYHPAIGIEAHHFDLYRFTHADEWLDAGLDELFQANSLCLIEWPARGGEHVPSADVHIGLTLKNGGRQCVVAAASQRGVALVHSCIDGESWQTFPAEL